MTYCPMTVKEQKQTLRRQMAQTLAGITAPQQQAAGAAISQTLHTLPAYQRAGCVFCYVGTGAEPNTRALLQQMLQEGKTVCIPLCEEKGVMTARKITDLAQLTPDAFGIPAPCGTAPCIAPQEIDLILVPCVAVTPKGARLGHGGGYYDRFLAAYSGTTAVLCFHAQLVAQLPQLVQDIPVDAIITEKEKILLNRNLL